MTNTYLLVAIKLHNHGNSPDYSISKGLIQSLSFKKQFFFSHLKKLSYSLRGRLNVIFLGKRFLVVNYLELFFFFIIEKVNKLGTLITLYRKINVKLKCKFDNYFT